MSYHKLMSIYIVDLFVQQFFNKDHKLNLANVKTFDELFEWWSDDDSLFQYTKFTKFYVGQIPAYHTPWNKKGTNPRYNE